jgi:ABC-type Zn2+ transport system substrate-binding protein/surface adhesin
MAYEEQYDDSEEEEEEDEEQAEGEEDDDDEEDDDEEEEVAKPVAKRGRSTKKWKVSLVDCHVVYFPVVAKICCSPPQDPSKPKRAMSAFFLYSQAQRSQVKEDNPEASFGDIVSHVKKVPMVF